MSSTYAAAKDVRQTVPGMIGRDPGSAAEQRYDLIIIGGGIHGACLLLEAARSGLRALLLERDDFGGATTGSSLRILHGGLRYLQNLDLRRFRTSVADRRWFCRYFPEHIKPLKCIMPLYGKGMRRRSIMRLALALNDLLSANRNRGVPARVHLPRGTVWTRRDVLQEVPELRRNDLQGAAVWYDAQMISSERILIEILHWAVAAGGTALNYIEAKHLLVAGDSAVGVEALDHADGSRLTFRAPVVVNCAGPWTDAVAQAFAHSHGDLFAPSLAFNLLLDRKPFSGAAVAVEPPAGGRTYFLVPWGTRTLAGTYHAPWAASTGDIAPTEGQVKAMIEDLNQAIPSLRLTGEAVSRVLSGLMPAVQPGSVETSSRTAFVDHGAKGGARGLYSVVGVKYTTAPSVARDGVRRIFGRRAGPRTGQRPHVPQPPDSEGGTEADWRTIIRDEAVLHLDDLMSRRVRWDPDLPPPKEALTALATEHAWDRSRLLEELARYNDQRRGSIRHSKMAGAT